MIPYLFHIYGPFYANCYGIAILFGIGALIFFALRDNILKKLVTKEQLFNIILFGTFIGIIGGRLLWAATHTGQIRSLYDLIAFWEPGYSLLGTIVCIAILTPWYIKKNNIRVVPFLDRIAIYAPLAQAIARIGCFCAGCCYGNATESFLGVIYSHHASIAPLGIKLHPTQLYSSFFLLLIFIFMYFVAQRFITKPGYLACFYLWLASCERFFIDFIRADREFFGNYPFSLFSVSQWIALGIMLSIGIIFKLREYNYFRSQNNRLPQ